MSLHGNGAPGSISCRFWDILSLADKLTRAHSRKPYLTHRIVPCFVTLTDPKRVARVCQHQLSLSIHQYFFNLLSCNFILLSYTMWMTHRPNTMTHIREYKLLPWPGWYDIHLLFSVLSRRQTCAPPWHKILATQLVVLILKHSPRILVQPFIVTYGRCCVSMLKITCVLLVSIHCTSAVDCPSQTLSLYPETVRHATAIHTGSYVVRSSDHNS